MLEQQTQLFVFIVEANLLHFVLLLKISVKAAFTVLGLAKSNKIWPVLYKHIAR